MTFKPHGDFALLQRLFPAIREFQQLADKHGIDDIFQDNGGKILQLCLCLGIDVLPGREGNDAVDATTGGEFELKTLNFRKKGGFTTHHHLNPTIIAKYRQVAWIFAAYEGIELRAIWKLTPDQMEPWFQRWSDKWHATSGKDINNPKIARKYVIEHGELLYSIGGPIEGSKPKKGKVPEVVVELQDDSLTQDTEEDEDTAKSRRPIVGRSIGRREGTLDFGKFPISAKMGPRYLMACTTTYKIIKSGVIQSQDDLADISEVKGMFNRVLRHDRPDWEAVRHLLGEPDRAVCHLAATWLAELRKLAKDGMPLGPHLEQPIARGVATALSRARDALSRAGFYPQ